MPWIINAILVPMLIGMGAWVWNTDRRVTINCERMDTLITDGSKALQVHLQTHGAKDNQLLVLGEDMKQIKSDVKSMSLLLTKIDAKLERESP